MISPELSHRLADALGTRLVTLDERRSVDVATLQAETWDDLLTDVQKLVEEIERRPWYGAIDQSSGAAL